VLHFPLDPVVARLQPLIFAGDELFARTGAGDGPAVLVTARGVRHTLRPIASRRVLLEHHLRLNRPIVANLLRRDLAGGPKIDLLRYFADLAVAFLERDWREDYPPEGGRQPSLEPDRNNQAVAADAPFPALPAPSLWLLGRAWKLGPGRGREGRLHVLHRGDVLELTGESATVGSVRSAWEAEVRAFVRSEVGRVLSRESLTGPPELIRMRAAVTQAGACQVGDLLFLDGTSPRLGHVIPPHHNRVLGRWVGGDLAVTAVLTLPPQITAPAVYQWHGANRWMPYYPPHGLCLGGGPPPVRPESPGLALAAYLRWAAWRIASNGAFHSSDDTPASEAPDAAPYDNTY
jgi:hypothetical protein